MEDIKFLNYVQIPGGKQQGDDYIWEGVAYVLFKTSIGAIANGFKVTRRISTGERFIGDGCWRLEGVAGTGESYKQWIMVDSNIAREQLKDFIVRNVQRILQNQVQESESVHHAQLTERSAYDTTQATKQQQDQRKSEQGEFSGMPQQVNEDDGVPF